MTGTAEIRAAARPGLRRAWPWLRTLGGVAILAALAWRLGTGAFLAGLRVVDVPSVLAALGIGVLTTVLCAVRWRIVARRLGLRLPLGRAVADYYRALFLNSVLPMGVLGDVQRAVGHGRDEGDLGRGVRAVVLERTAGQVVLVAVAVVVLLSGSGTAATGGLLVAVAAAVAGLAVALALALRRPGESRWRRALRTSLADARVGLLSRDTWFPVLALSAAVLAGHVALFLVAARTAGSGAPVSGLVAPIVLALLAAGLPVNVGGWGPRESVTALTFAADGLVLQG